MKNIPRYDNNYLVYPGVYVPTMNEKQVKKELNFLHKEISLSPSVNVTETGKTYKVEIAIPGAKPEDFFVHACGRILHVTVLHKEALPEKKGKDQLHSFRYNCFDRKIVLPEKSDTEFISAEYISGILRLHVQKAGTAARRKNTKIAVY